PQMPHPGAQARPEPLPHGENNRYTDDFPKKKRVRMSLDRWHPVRKRVMNRKCDRGRNRNGKVHPPAQFRTEHPSRIGRRLILHRRQLSRRQSLAHSCAATTFFALQHEYCVSDKISSAYVWMSWLAGTCPSSTFSTCKL